MINYARDENNEESLIKDQEKFSKEITEMENSFQGVFNDTSKDKILELIREKTEKESSASSANPTAGQSMHTVREKTPRVKCGSAAPRNPTNATAKPKRTRPAPATNNISEPQLIASASTKAAPGPERE